MSRLCEACKHKLRIIITVRLCRIGCVKASLLLCRTVQKSRRISGIKMPIHTQQLNFVSPTFKFNITEMSLALFYRHPLIGDTHKKYTVLLGDLCIPFLKFKY